MPPAVEMLDIVKDFPGVRANDGVSVSVEEGSVHALLGENGAGKSTLMSILFGLYRPDSGRILVRGREVRIRDPNEASALGIGMVHQHFKLVPGFSVAQNIVLGREPLLPGGFLDIRGAEEKVARLSSEYGLCVDPRASVDEIGVGMQQRVEILKMLYRDSDILILDEPTAVLTPQETAELIQIIQGLSAGGKTVILITHKLREIKAAATACTVLRRGKVEGTVDVASTPEEEMARMMVGRSVSFRVEKGPAKSGEAALELRSLRARNARGLEALRGVDLLLREGEILGICGVDGNGQDELVQAVFGLIKAESGSILVRGRDMTRSSVRERLDAGLGLVPADRQRQGLVLDFSLAENFALHDWDRPPTARLGVLDRGAMAERAKRLMEAFDVRSGGGPGAPARSLSGGNQQKAIVAREIDRSPAILVVAQPTRGLDVGAIEYIHRRLVAERDAGKAVLLVSFELDEVLQLSDRVAVMHGGRIVGLMDAAAAEEEELGLLMAGSAGKAG